MSVSSPETGSFQFDKAEFDDAQSGVACAACKRPIDDTYFEVNGHILCPGCQAQVTRSLGGGAGIRRGLLAVALGTGAAALGAALWYAVRAITHLEIGLISIAIGVGVGMAVRKGSGGRGGWVYQALAMFLTYSAVAMTYFPDVVSAIVHPPAQQEAASAKAPPVPAAADPAAPESPEAGEATTPGAAPEADQAAVAPAAKPAAASEASSSEGVPLGALLLFAAYAIGICYAAPFLGGFENIIGILIIAFGVYEAWKINRRVEVSISGPLRVTRESSAPAETDANA